MLWPYSVIFLTKFFHCLFSIFIFTCVVPGVITQEVEKVLKRELTAVQLTKEATEAQFTEQ